MAFSEQTFKKSIHDAWNSLVRPVGSASAARNRGLSLLKSLAAAPVTRDLLKSTGAGQLINDKRLRNHDSQEVREASPLWVVAGAAADRKEGPSYGTPHGMPQVEISLYCVLKGPLIS